MLVGKVVRKNFATSWIFTSFRAWQQQQLTRAGRSHGDVTELPKAQGPKPTLDPPHSTSTVHRLGSVVSSWHFQSTDSHCVQIQPRRLITLKGTTQKNYRPWFCSCFAGMSNFCLGGIWINRDISLLFARSPKYIALIRSFALRNFFLPRLHVPAFYSGRLCCRFNRRKLQVDIGPKKVTQSDCTCSSVGVYYRVDLGSLRVEAYGI